MLQKVMKCYAVQKMVKVPSIDWFESDGVTPAFGCHPLNVRAHKSALDEYTETIGTDGVIQDARGVPYCTLSDTPSGKPYRLITFGTLGRAAYLAFAKYGNDETRVNVHLSKQVSMF